MKPARSHADDSTPSRAGGTLRTIAWTASGIGAAVGATAAASTILSGLFARTLLTPRATFLEDTVVVAVAEDDSSVTIADTPESTVPGVYSLWFHGGAGHAVIGDVLDRGDGTVTRALLSVSGGPLVVGIRCRLNGWVYGSPDDLGIAAEEVTIPTQYGAAPAWRFPPTDPESTRWAIHVHGRATVRQETLRGVAVFRDAGFTSLSISYRNDGTAPESPDRRYGLGATEWLDVDSAIRYAARNGATSIVLVGWSMGGAISLQTLMRSTSSALIAGLVLDSPVVDWRRTLELQARLLHLPTRLIRGVERLMRGRVATRITGGATPVDLRTFDFVRRSSELDRPILLLHSDDDGYVPVEPSRDLARRRPDLVTFVPFTTARHTKLWNADRDRWTEAVASWLRAL